MAYQPICIITPTGMVCASSPLKEHQPSGHECREVQLSGGKAKMFKQIRKYLEAHHGIADDKQRHVIETVVRLMLVKDVGESGAFTIVRAS